MSREPHLVLLCGRYEGIDERVRDALATEEISIGDYVLSGGELAAMVIVDAVARQVPGVVGDAQSVDEDSFADRRLDHPHYTRPAEFEGWRVPEVLLSGHHAEIARVAAARVAAAHAGSTARSARGVRPGRRDAGGAGRVEAASGKRREQEP